MKKLNAARLVAEALLGTDRQTVTVNGETYTIEPPTIKRICGAGLFLSDFGEEKSVGDSVREFESMANLAHAASWFIKGDDSLAETFMDAQVKDLLGVLETALALIDVQNFTRLSLLARNVKMAIAKQRQ